MIDAPVPEPERSGGAGTGIQSDIWHRPPSPWAIFFVPRLDSG